MKQRKEISVEYSVYDTVSELTQEEGELIQKARSATDLSHAPYSKFYVGAAVLLDDGSILKGANQENASYPMCNCAEQVVLNHASMAQPDKKIISMAVAIRSDFHQKETPVPPCGACRQIILEQEHRQGSDISLYLVASNDLVYVFDSIKSLLPLHFSFE